MNTDIRVMIATLIAATVLPGAALAQEQVKPVTVCEILADPTAFSDKPVAIVGRLDCTFSFESACRLAEDHCDRPFVSDDRTWPNKIWIELVFPASPKSKVEVDPTVLSEKLSVIRKSTKLGTHRVMLLKKKDGVLVPDRWSDQPDEWGMAYGRILVTKALQHYSGAGVALKINPNDLRSFKDGTFPAAESRK